MWKIVLENGLGREGNSWGFFAVVFVFVVFHVIDSSFFSVVICVIGLML